jgi:hypothetical protein
MISIMKYELVIGLLMAGLASACGESAARTLTGADEHARRYFEARAREERKAIPPDLIDGSNRRGRRAKFSLVRPYSPA